MFDIVYLKYFVDDDCDDEDVPLFFERLSWASLKERNSNKENVKVEC